MKSCEMNCTCTNARYKGPVAWGWTQVSKNQFESIITAHFEVSGVTPRLTLCIWRIIFFKFGFARVEQAICFGYTFSQARCPQKRAVFAYPRVGCIVYKQSTHKAKN